jgi:NAD(P)-dependent dehydrogenase (short-subunit alcohol dehydrogenase family)
MPARRLCSDQAITPTRRRNDFLRRILRGRMGAPDEIATVILFLVSRAASYMSGSLVVVDDDYLAG